MKPSKTTMADIARLSGVSQSTVSLVLNQKGGRAIPPETVARVLDAVRELHYTKPQRNQVRRKGADHPVLILVSDLTNPYYSFILHELELAAAPSGLHLVCCNTYHHVEQETGFLEMALRCGFFAAIFLYPPEPFAAPYRLLYRPRALLRRPIQSGMYTKAGGAKFHSASVMIASFVYNYMYRYIELSAQGRYLHLWKQWKYFCFKHFHCFLLLFTKNASIFGHTAHFGPTSPCALCAIITFFHFDFHVSCTSLFLRSLRRQD